MKTGTLEEIDNRNDWVSDSPYLDFDRTYAPRSITPVSTYAQISSMDSRNETPNPTNYILGSD